MCYSPPKARQAQLLFTPRNSHQPPQDSMELETNTPIPSAGGFHPSHPLVTITQSSMSTVLTEILTTSLASLLTSTSSTEEVIDSMIKFLDFL